MNRAAFHRHFDVSHETLERLDTFVDLLRKWSRAINLIGPTDEEELWARHISDSAQLILHCPPGTRSWLDLGSGAGLPGLVIAILAAERQRPITFQLTEADKRKAAFLREASRQTQTPVDVISERIESLPPRAADVLSARAFAPLHRLLRYTQGIAPNAGTLLLHKGRTVQSEIDAVATEWEIEYSVLPSLTDPDGSILKITEFSSRQ